MPFPRPSKLPTWATAVGAPITEPPDVSKANGWTAGIKPPHEWFNYWWNLVYQWIGFISKASPFDDLATAATTAESGDVAIVWEDDGLTGSPAAAITKNTGVALTNRAQAAVDSCGTIVVWGLNTVVKVSTRAMAGVESGGTPLLTLTLSHVGTVARVRTDGTFIFVAYGFYVEAFLASTGASLWVHDNSSVAIKDMCVSRGKVFIVHQKTGGGGDTVDHAACHALSKITGAVVWSFRHGNLDVNNVLAACCCNGRQLFVAGLPSDYASGANMRALRVTDGAAATNEGGAPVDDDALAWNVVLADDVQQACMEADAFYLYAGFDNAAASQMIAFNQTEGTTAYTFADPDSSMSANAITVDQDFVYLATSDGAGTPEGFLRAFRRGTSQPSWKWGWTGGSADHAPMLAICSDGQAIFAIADTAQRAFRITRGNAPMLGARISHTLDHPTYGNWILQPR